MRKRLLSLPCLALAIAACGTNVGDDAGAETPGPAERALSGTVSTFGGSTARPDSATDTGPCATLTVESKLAPVDLVVMYDQSGSMGDTAESPSFDPAKRWIPVATAMKAFFSDPQSAGISAALTFFANPSDGCSVASYATPELGRTALPSPLFAQAIDRHQPRGDTPTRAAVLGAIAQAEGNLVAHPGSRTAVVLVTDGDPWGCGVVSPRAEAQAIAAEVAKVAPKFPTYVVGVGDSVENVQDIATAGGTKAFRVEVGDALATSQQLGLAMEAIRGAAGTCELDIPAPPDGRVLDLDKVVVALAETGKPDETLAYSADCANPRGFRFDATGAKKILLCSAACESSKVKAHGAAKVQFACTNRVDVVR